MKIKRRKKVVKEKEQEVKKLKEERKMNTYLLEFGTNEEAVARVVIVAENVFEVLKKFIVKYDTQDIQLENLYIDISIPEVIQ